MLRELFPSFVRVPVLVTLAALLAGCPGASILGGGIDAGHDVTMDTHDVMASCGTGQSRCNGTCIDTQGDRDNCGACGNACPGGQVCVAGACAVACPTGQVVCNGRCVDLNTDRGNCGTCGTACTTGMVCSMGSCSLECATGLATCGADAGSGRYCANTQTDRNNCGTCGTVCPPGNICQGGSCAISCPTGETPCGSLCIDLQNNNQNCGACGTTCATGMVCSAGACALTCAAGLTTCGGDDAGVSDAGMRYCADTRTDRNNCGACGFTCMSGFDCVGGSCVLTCPSGQMACGTYCADLGNDRNNCGACGAMCPAGQACSGGACGATCRTGLTDCMGACRDLLSDPAACGSCSNVCPSGPNSVPACAGGHCALTCTAGFGDCDGDPTNGCETALNTAANCGACGSVCNFAHAADLCTAGHCAIGACDTGFVDCNGAPSDGCEVNTQTDNANCGACGTVCPAGQVCSSGGCTATCRAGLTNCSGDCHDLTNDPAACGACGTVCPSGSNSTAVCTAGHCGLSCAAGFGDCDGNPMNGCETDLSTVGNCAACGNVCTFANASASCTAGHCALGTCTFGFADCNGNAADGCEINTQADNANCGSCGSSCPAGQICSSGSCVATCRPGLTACLGICRDLTSDPGSCGGCGTVCPSGPNSTATCSASTCGLRCAAGFADCDGNPANGCETAITSVTNCGACGNACSFANAGAACTAMHCAMGACTAGFLDCNGSSADGCEVNANSNNANCGTCGHACGAGTVCASGTCSPTCGSPLTMCGGSCVNPTNDPSHCGSCSTVCPPEANASPVCVTGSCNISCNAGFANCNANVADGCEVNVQTSASNCGTCGHVCSLANATAACTAGACTIGSCNAGFSDCDGNPTNGCETSGPCLPACYTGPRRVLVYGDGGTGSVPYFPAGTAVTVASDAMWNAMTTAQFQQYDVIWVDSNSCGGTTASMATLRATIGVWGPAVTGRIMNTTTDADLHAGGGDPNPRLFIANNVTWIGGLGRDVDGGRTGLYLSWGCTGASGTVTANDLAAVIGSGWTPGPVGCDAGAMTAAAMTSGPLVGMNNSQLNWGCYSHGYFTSIPSGFTVETTGVSTGTSTYTAVIRDQACR